MFEDEITNKVRKFFDEELSKMLKKFHRDKRYSRVFFVFSILIFGFSWLDVFIRNSGHLLNLFGSILMFLSVSFVAYSNGRFKTLIKIIQMVEDANRMEHQ